MTRITPRTCLWPLAASLVFTFALSIGLTFRSNHHCYAGTCGEWLFPLQARLHVIVWYFWLAISVTVLTVRAFQLRIRKTLQRPVFVRKLPWIGKQLGVGGFLIVLWILSLYGIIVGIWWVRLRDYFVTRGTIGGVSTGNARLAAIALTGHLCDVTMGMAIMPISRHSALGSFFKISVATTLAFHMVTAYTLFALVLTHGLLYVSWIPIFEALSTGLRRVYPVLNPTYLFEEAWPGNRSSLGVWRASLIFTGSVTTFIMLLIFITTLPAIRKKHFNIFYFTHLLSIPAIIIICLHASTMLYCTAPGLMMWLLDWLMRLYELWAPLHGNIQAVGKGWYRLSVPLPRTRLDGCACTSPLAHFFIHHTDSSRRELHPFTTTTHLASQNTVTHRELDDIHIQFLFRKRGAAVTIPDTPSDGKLGITHTIFKLIRKLSMKKSQAEWTNRLASCADELDKRKDSESTLAESSQTASPTASREVAISLRLEGPYFTIANPASYNTVVCIVAGTGISGGLAISGAFKELERQSAIVTPPEESCQTGCAVQTSRCGVVPPVEMTTGKRNGGVVTLKGGRVWTRCIVIWSIREDTYIELPELTTTSTSALDVRIHMTGGGRQRLSVGDELDEILKTNVNEGSPGSPASTWVYISGPNAFIEAGETACKERQMRGLEWYGAKWDI